MLGNKIGEQTARHAAQTPRVGLLRRYGAGADWQAVLEDADEDGSGIVVGSAAWFVWLAAPSTQSFGYPVYDAQAGYIDGFMTVRKERRARGGRYWVAYRRTQGRLRKVYLGPSSKLTHQALEQVAQTLLTASTRTAPGPRTDGDSD